MHQIKNLFITGVPPLSCFMVIKRSRFSCYHWRSQLDAKELWSSKETMRARPPGPRESREAWTDCGAVCEVSNCGFWNANFVAHFEDFGPFTREIKTYCKGFEACDLQLAIVVYSFAKKNSVCAKAHRGLPFKFHPHAHCKITTCYASLLGPWMDAGFSDRHRNMVKKCVHVLSVRNRTNMPSRQTSNNYWTWGLPQWFQDIPCPNRWWTPGHWPCEWVNVLQLVGTPFTHYHWFDMFGFRSENITSQIPRFIIMFASNSFPWDPTLKRETKSEKWRKTSPRPEVLGKSSREIKPNPARPWSHLAKT